MIDETHIRSLEQRYRELRKDFEAGKLDEAAFTAAVDQLQFQDDWGRYWMIGAQSGNWHYYDGQAWQQADPRDADKLPFVDEYGRYWQRGVKSGEWYYFQPETGEWVKPEPGAVQSPAYSSGQAATASQGYAVDSGMPAGLDAELYQDDEGRYWAIGRKTGQWYFYDYDGWHPAHEFQSRVASAQMPQMQQMQPVQPQAYPPSPQSQTPGQPPTGYQAEPGYTPSAGQGPQPSNQGYYVQAQPVTSPTQPIQIYITPSQPEGGQAIVSRPTAPVEPQTPSAPASESSAGSPVEPPAPPVRQSESGNWFYFDGEKWLRYSTGEPDATVPPPKMVVEQKPQPAADVAAAKETKEEKVEAELFEEDEPPVEVVDVEVVTVIEPEPEPEPPVAAAPAAAQTPPQPVADDVRPRRRPTQPVAPAGAEQESERRARTPSEPMRPAAPRRRAAAHEPTLILPTDTAAPRPPSPRARAGETQPVRPPAARQRRARQDTAPMETVSDDNLGTDELPHRATRPMPRPRDTAPVPQKSTQEAAEDQSVRQKAQDAAAQTAESSAGSRFPLGDLLRSLPSTVWMFAGGLVLLLACAFGLIFTWGWFQGSDLGSAGLAVDVIPTPTLDSGPPDATPTPGPTPTPVAEVVSTSTPAPMAVFSSKELGYTVEYPDSWQQADDSSCAIFSPSEDGLDRDNLKDAAIWICKSDEDDVKISDLLARILADFPADAETLNEGTISIAAQTWTSAQIRYPDDNLGGQGIATLAVTNKDGVGYYLVAVAPAEDWNARQPLFQAMINSFTFSTDVVAQATAVTSATPTPRSTRRATPTATATPEAADETPEPQVYVVQPGDTLLGIALNFGVDADALAAKNNIDNPEALQIGQELIIPTSDEDVEPVRAETSPTAEAKSGAVTATPTPKAQEVVEATPAPTPEPTEEAEAEPAALSGKIAYPAFNPGTNTYDIWLLNVASGEQSVLATDASQPAFNRDGSLLAYRSWALGNSGIFFIDYVGGRSGFLTRFVEDALPTWSPDGFTFAFASRREGDRVSRIFVGNQTGKDDFSIGFQGIYPSTFPDGRLVVKGCSPQGDCGLYVMGPTGGGETKISGETSDTAPAVSPDGSKIAFMSSGRGATNWEIWVMNADGSDPRRLTENGSNEGLPAWSPDGKSIAYVSDQGGVWAIWVMNADGSNQRKLANMMGSPDGQVLRNMDNSKGWLEERISWAP